MRKTLTFAALCLSAINALLVPCAAQGATGRGKELKRAGAVLDKLRRLEESSHDLAAFRRAVAKLYPDLYVNISGLDEGDLKADIFTAAVLYESAARAHAVTDGEPYDCGGELRESYLRACRESAGGGRPAVLRAKAALHTRRAELRLRLARGLSDAATEEAMLRLRAERETDLAIAEEALRALAELGDLAGKCAANSAEPARLCGMAQGSTEALAESFERRLTEIDRLLASLPRDAICRALTNARDAFRDGLFWQLKRLPGHALVVRADSYAAPDPLQAIGLDDGAASRAALGNWRAALKFTRHAEAAVRHAREAAQR